MGQWTAGKIPSLPGKLRALINLNNLVAAFLLQMLVPPPGLIEQLQWLLVDLFLLGHHWVQASVMNLPVAVPAPLQGLKEISSRTATFGLQEAQWLLYSDECGVNLQRCCLG